MQTVCEPVTLHASAQVGRRFQQLAFRAPLISQILQPGQAVLLSSAQVHKGFMLPLAAWPVKRGPGLLYLLIDASELPATNIMDEAMLGAVIMLGGVGRGYPVDLTRRVCVVCDYTGAAAACAVACARGEDHPSGDVHAFVLGDDEQGDAEDAADWIAGFIGDQVPRIADAGKLGEMAGWSGTDTIVYSAGTTEFLHRLLAVVPKEIPTFHCFSDAQIPCGTGACVACAVETPAGYKRACQEGPVFDVQAWR
jgi:dihydroorotate dehydrogenase electron transfer subunit